MNPSTGSRPRLGQPSQGGRPGQGLLGGAVGRVLGVVVGTVIAISALFMSMIAFAAVLVVGSVAAAWFWWRTRDVRRQLRGQMAEMQKAFERGEPFRPGSPFPGAGPGRNPGHNPGRGQGDVLDGDFIREAPPSRDADRS